MTENESGLKRSSKLDFLLNTLSWQERDMATSGCFIERVRYGIPEADTVLPDHEVLRAQKEVERLGLVTSTMELTRSACSLRRLGFLTARLLSAAVKAVDLGVVHDVMLAATCLSEEHLLLPVVIPEGCVLQEDDRRRLQDKLTAAQEAREVYRTTGRGHLWFLRNLADHVRGLEAKDLGRRAKELHLSLPVMRKCWANWKKVEQNECYVPCGGRDVHEDFLRCFVQAFPLGRKSSIYKGSYDLKSVPDSKKHEDFAKCGAAADWILVLDLVLKGPKTLDAVCSQWEPLPEMLVGDGHWLHEELHELRGIEMIAGAAEMTAGAVEMIAGAVEMTTGTFKLSSVASERPTSGCEDPCHLQFVQAAACFVRLHHVDGIYDLQSFCQSFQGERPRKIASIVSSVETFGRRFGLGIVEHVKWGPCLQLIEKAEISPGAESGITDGPTSGCEDPYHLQFVQAAACFVRLHHVDGIYDLQSFCQSFQGERPRKITSIVSSVETFGRRFGLSIVEHVKWGPCVQLIDKAEISPGAESGITDGSSWLVEFTQKAALFVNALGDEGVYDIGSFCRDFPEERPRKQKSIVDAIMTYGDQFGVRIIEHPQWGQCMESFSPTAGPKRQRTETMSLK